MSAQKWLAHHPVLSSSVVKASHSCTQDHGLNSHLRLRDFAEFVSYITSFHLLQVRLCVGISDEIEIATIAIDQTKIRSKRRLHWQFLITFDNIRRTMAGKEIYQKLCCTFFLFNLLLLSLLFPSLSSWLFYLAIIPILDMQPFDGNALRKRRLWLPIERLKNVISLAKYSSP